MVGRFAKRHPNLTLRAPSKLSLARARASDPEVIGSYFDMLEKVMTEYDLFDKPGQIFNVDETGMPLDFRPPKVICQKGVRTVSSISSGKKTQITIVASMNAIGNCVPPMVILNVKTMHTDMAIGEVRGTLHAFSDSGWIDMELFDVWFNRVFLRYTPAARPILLLMDGHSTHYSPETIRVAAKHQVILFTLPPNNSLIPTPRQRGLWALESQL